MNQINLRGQRKYSKLVIDKNIIIGYEALEVGLETICFSYLFVLTFVNQTTR